MPRGNWRIILTALGLVVALAVIGYGYRQVKEATVYPYAKEDYQPSAKARFRVSVKGEPQPKGYEPNCKQPKDQGDSDLCAQWAAVKAVNESNRLVRTGILLSYVLGMLGLAVTAAGTLLVYRTLRQSDDSLRAAQAGLAQGYRSERAYITFRVQQDKPVRYNGTSMAVYTDALNIGRTPARVFASHGFRLDTLPDAASYRAEAMFKDDFYVIGADGAMPFETPTASNSRAIHFFVSAIPYIDSFGHKHEAWGCIAFDPVRQELRNVGGSAWNSDEEMKGAQDRSNQAPYSKRLHPQPSV